MRSRIHSDSWSSRNPFEFPELGPFQSTLISVLGIERAESIQSKILGIESFKLDEPQVLGIESSLTMMTCFEWKRY